ncbi:MAG: hypothetical protein WD011_08260, partial [Nitriliruptoraceae bacterium]
ALVAGVVAMLIADSLDSVIRGPRHVRAAAGELVAVLPRDAAADAGRDLADAILDTRVDDAVIKVGLSAVSTGAFAVGPWVDALGVSLAGRGASVLVLDLASGTLERDGAAEVAAGRRRFSDVAEIDRDLRLARLGPGRDPERALWGLPKLVSRLPADLDVLVVALPPAASRLAIEAMTVLDHALLVAERDRTTRVELLTALTAVARVREPAQVVLLDDPTADRLGLTAESTPAAPVARDPFGLAERHLRPPEGLAPSMPTPTPTSTPFGGGRPEDSGDRANDEAGGETPIESPTQRDRTGDDEPTALLGSTAEAPSGEEPTAILGPTTGAAPTSGADTPPVEPATATPQRVEAGNPLAPSTPPAQPRVTDETEIPPASTGGAPIADGPPETVSHDIEGAAPTRATRADLAPQYDREAADDADEEPAHSDVAPAGPRDVDLLLGAAAAEAAMYAEGAPDTIDGTAEVPPIGDVVDDQPAPGDVSADARAPVAPEPYAAPSGEQTGRSNDEDAGAPEFLPSDDVDDEDPDDILRTTAQMAILMDNLEERDDT